MVLYDDGVDVFHVLFDCGVCCFMWLCVDVGGVFVVVEDCLFLDPWRCRLLCEVVKWVCWVLCLLSKLGCV